MPMYEPPVPPPVAPRAASPVRRSSATSATEAVEAAARAIQRTGLATAYATAGPALEPQPAPTGPGRMVTTAVSGAVAVGAVALMWLWPVLGALLLLATLASAYVDADGGRGWLRRLLPRGVSYNLVVWPAPLPRRVVGQRPCLLLCAPLSPRAEEPGAAARLLLEIARRLRERPPAHLEVVFALLGGGADGLEVLLLNHEARLSVSRTRVLCLHPGAPAWVAREGVVHPRAADATLSAAARAANLPPLRGTTLAARALRLGWRAGSLRGDPAAADAASSLIAALDEVAGSPRW